MNTNPYEKIIQTMRDEGARKNPSTIQLGTIESTDPFLLSVGALELDSDDVLISEHLLNVDTKASISWRTESAGEPAHTHQVKGDKDIQIKSTLKPDDTVIVYRIDDTFVIIDKVVEYVSI